MERYFTNLWLALLGRSPYLAEMKEMKEMKSMLEKALVELEKLNEMYEQALAAREKSDRLVASLEKRLKKMKGKMTGAKKKTGQTM